MAVVDEAVQLLGFRRGQGTGGEARVDPVMGIRLVEPQIGMHEHRLLPI